MVKSVSEYKTHSLRDKSGKGGVTLCCFCHEKGHTTSICPTLKKRRDSMDPREKYDVSGLPPMPAKLQPLVMPVRGLPPMPAKLQPLVMPLHGLPPMPAKLQPLAMPLRGVQTKTLERTYDMEALTIAVQGLKIADYETISHDEDEDDEDEDDEDEDEDEDDMTIVEMRQGENDRKLKFNWADQCDSDVDDDEF